MCVCVCVGEWVGEGVIEVGRVGFRRKYHQPPLLLPKPDIIIVATKVMHVYIPIDVFRQKVTTPVE